MMIHGTFPQVSKAHHMSKIGPHEKTPPPSGDPIQTQATYPPGSLPFNFEARKPWYFYNGSKEILPGKTSGAKYLPVINGHLGVDDVDGGYGGGWWCFWYLNSPFFSSDLHDLIAWLLDNSKSWPWIEDHDLESKIMTLKVSWIRIILVES